MRDKESSTINPDTADPSARCTSRSPARPPIPDTQHPPARRLTWTGYYTLVLVGVYVTVLGPGLPGLARRTHVELVQAGTLFTALFAGGLITSVGAGRSMDRFGRRPLLLAGMLLNALGCLGLSLATTWPRALGAAVLLGTGDSMIVVGTHVLFSDLYQDTAGAALNRLNVYFGLGALAGPALAGLSIRASGDIRYALWLVAAGQVLAALLIAAAVLPAMPARAAEGRELGLRQLLRRPLLWLLSLLLLLYVGLEAGLGGWAFTFLHRQGGFSTGTAVLLTSGYWLALALGRALSPFALRRLSDARFLLLASLFTAAAALLLVLFAGWRPGAAVCILLTGFGFGPIWATSFAVGTNAYRQGAGAVSGILAAAGSIGGLAGPLLQGILLLQHGPYWGMAFTLAGSAGMALLAVAVLRRLPGGRE